MYCSYCGESSDGSCRECDKTICNSHMALCQDCGGIWCHEHAPTQHRCR